MKRITIFFLLISLFEGCSPNSPQPTNDEILYKKAIVRTKNVYVKDQNIDQYNDLKIQFNTLFEEQLVELSLFVSGMNSSSLTILNANGSEESFSKDKTISYGEVDVFLNGISVKDCLVAQCKSYKCSNVEGDDLEGNFETTNIYLNLSNIVAGNCQNAEIYNGSNSLVVKHIKDDEGPEYQGKRVRADISVFNIANTPQGMANIGL